MLEFLAKLNFDSKWKEVFRSLPHLSSYLPAPFLLPLPLSYDTHSKFIFQHLNPPLPFLTQLLLHQFIYSWCLIKYYFKIFCYWSFNKTLWREVGILHENSQSFHNIVSFPIIEAGILEAIPSENFHSVFFFIREYLLLLAPQWITYAPPAFCHYRSPRNSYEPVLLSTLRDLLYFARCTINH